MLRASSSRFESFSAAGPRHAWLRPRCAASTRSRHQHTAAAAAANEDTSGGWTSGAFVTRMHVRDYELDQFGVVNNAIYASYCQHARHEAFRDMGFPIDAMTVGGTALALASLSLQYLAPLRSRDTFDVTVWVEKMTGVRLVIGHEITLVSTGRQEDARRPGQTVVKAEAVVVWLDEKYAPVRIPADVRAAFSGMQQARTAAATSATSAAAAASAH